MYINQLILQTEITFFFVADVLNPNVLKPRVVSITQYFKKLWASFNKNLVEELGRWQEQTNLILVQVRMQIRPISGIQNVNCTAEWRYTCTLPSAVIVLCIWFRRKIRFWRKVYSAIFEKKKHFQKKISLLKIYLLCEEWQV